MPRANMPARRHVHKPRDVVTETKVAEMQEPAVTRARCSATWRPRAGGGWLNVSFTRSWPANGRAGPAAATGAASARQSAATNEVAQIILFIPGPPFDPGPASAADLYEGSMRDLRAALECRRHPHAGTLMKFGILGPLRVSSGDGDLDLGAPAQRTLLAILLTSPGTPVSDDRLIDELWGEDPPSSAHHLLQVYVSRLRALAGAPSDGLHIDREGAGYALRVGAGELDAELFADALAAARPFVSHDPEAVDRILTPAMRLWRGTPFADLADPPQAVREHAVHLEGVHREALGTWIDVRLRLGRHRELVPELAALVRQQPYDEALHAQQVLALYRCGRQAEALETARALEARLREDLGIDPSPEVRGLYRDILLQAPHLSLEPPEPPGNLPSTLTSFVGRKRELQELAGLVLESRLVTLTGPGGIGKTRLALEVARQQRSQFPGGTWWIDLASVTDPETVLDQVAGALGMAPMPGPALLGAIVRALGRRRVLLLIDNCEHVAAAVADVVSELLRATTAPRVLATSRIRLGVEGERLWPVPALGLPAAGSPTDVLAGCDAVQLFVERVERSARGSSSTPVTPLRSARCASGSMACRSRSRWWPPDWRPCLRGRSPAISTTGSRSWSCRSRAGRPGITRWRR